MATLLVRVMRDGEPVKGASVKLWCGFKSSWIAEAESGGDGRATLECRWKEEVDVYVNDELRISDLHLSNRDEDKELRLSA